MNILVTKVYLMSWKVVLHRSVDKFMKDSRVPQDVKEIFETLVIDLEDNGPTRNNWPNYGKLKGIKQYDKRHCHIKKGRPTYVVCWQVYQQEITIEVFYVGTHEKAPY